MFVLLDQIFTEIAHIDLDTILDAISEFNFGSYVFQPVKYCEINGFCNVEASIET